jgi:uncharacterized membrane protein YdjX (TVP38/TMEM64 family)
MRFRQVFLLLLLASAIGTFVALDLGRFLSFEQLKASQASFAQLHADQPFIVAAAYFLIYVLATALSIPGAVIITLAGGAVFGLWQGLLIVSFASTVGATLAFLASRFLLREWVEARFGQRLADINAGVDKEGAFYLFTLRLIPVVPFWAIPFRLKSNASTVALSEIVSPIVYCVVFAGRVYESVRIPIRAPSDVTLIRPPGWPLLRRPCSCRTPCPRLPA